MVGNSKLEHLAIRVAVEATRTQGKYVSDAKVPWDTLHELRAEIERRGFDLDEMLTKYARLVGENAQKREARRRESA